MKSSVDASESTVEDGLLGTVLSDENGNEGGVEDPFVEEPYLEDPYALVDDFKVVGPPWNGKRIRI